MRQIGFFVCLFGFHIGCFKKWGQIQKLRDWMSQSQKFIHLRGGRKVLHACVCMDLEVLGERLISNPTDYTDIAAFFPCA